MSASKVENWKKQAGLFLLSQAVSLIGFSLVQYALLLYITLKTGSGVMMTVYIAAGALMALMAIIIPMNKTLMAAGLTAVSE